MVTFKTRKSDKRVFPIVQSNPKTNISPSIVKLKRTPKIIIKIRISGFQSNVNVLKKRIRENKENADRLKKDLKRQELNLKREKVKL